MRYKEMYEGTYRKVINVVNDMQQVTHTVGTPYYYRNKLTITNIEFDHNPHEMHRSYVNIHLSDGTMLREYNFSSIYFDKEKGEE